MIVVNKCDGDLQSSAQHTAADYSGSLQFIRQKYNLNSYVYLLRDLLPGRTSLWICNLGI